jgi:hypothetical protein
LYPPISPGLCDTTSTCQPALGVACVHAEQVAREQRRFVPAGAGADLEKDVALVVGVARQQQALQLGLQRSQALAALAHLGVRELAHLRVRRHVLSRLDVRDTPVGAEQLHHRPDLRVLARGLR